MRAVSYTHLHQGSHYITGVLYRGSIVLQTVKKMRIVITFILTLLFNVTVQNNMLIFQLTRIKDMHKINFHHILHKPVLEYELDMNFTSTLP